MTSEEIKALGLREDVSEIYDVTIRCHVSELAEDEDYIQAEVGDGVILKSIIVAMERVMPPLPDGWEWKDAVRFGFAVEMKRDALTATIDADTGGIECWTTSQGPGQSGEHPSGRGRPCPALIAKALIEVWEQGQ